MNEKVLHTLEYNKILDQLTEYAFSADARSRCQKLRPITDRAQNPRSARRLLPDHRKTMISRTIP